jgi:hypothetical protein
MKMTVAPFGNKKNKESISYFYNFRSDPKLGPGRIPDKRVPCACSSCSQQLELDWIDNVPAENQPRYKQNKNCHLWKIFEGLNDWHLLQLREPEDSSKEGLVQSQRLVVKSWVDNLGPKIHSGPIGAQSNIDGYYLLQFAEEPHKVQEATVLEGYEPPIEIVAGEIVVKGFYMNEVPRANNWFTPSTPLDSKNGPKLPAVCNKKQARELGAKLLLIADHNALLDEMQRHFLEENDDFMEVFPMKTHIQIQKMIPMILTTCGWVKKLIKTWTFWTFFADFWSKWRLADRPM